MLSKNMDTRRNKTNYYLDIAEEVSSWLENDEKTLIAQKLLEIKAEIFEERIQKCQKYFF